MLPGRQLDRLVVVVLLQGGKLQGGVAPDGLAQLGARQVETVRLGDQGVVGVARIVGAANAPGAEADALVDGLGPPEHHRGVAGQEVEEGVEGRVEEGQVVLDARKVAALAGLLLEACAESGRHLALAREGGQRVHEAGHCATAEDLLAHRQQHRLLHGEQGALGRRIEEPQGLDLVAPEFDPQGGLVARREDVQHVPADAEAARVLREVRAQVTPLGQGGHHPVPVDLLAHHQQLLGVAQDPAWQRPAEQGRHGGDHHVRLAVH